MRRLVAEEVGDHRREPEHRDRHAEDGNGAAGDVSGGPRILPAVGPDRRCDGQPDHCGTEHQGRSRSGGWPQDLRYRPLLDVGEAEVAVREVVHEQHVLLPVRLVQSVDPRDLGDLLGRGRLAGDALGGRGASEARDDVEQQPGKQGDRDDLDDRAAEALEYDCSHQRPPGASASRKPSPARLNASMVITSARPGASARVMSVWYIPDVTASESICPQLGVGGGTPTPR